MVDRLRHSMANQRRIENIDACFSIHGEALWVDGRVLIGEGVLMKMCRKKAKPRQFFLFNDILVYGSIILSKKRYRNQRIIPLEEVQLVNLEDEGSLKHGWIIKTRVKSFSVYAGTEAEKREWMLHIERCVQELIRNGKRPAQDHAAVWVPDNETTTCMCCRSAHFTLINRRHHCRSCGHVVCGACSSKKFLLPGIAKCPVRVCNTCYDQLSNGDISVITNKTPESDESEEEDQSEAVATNETTFYRPNTGTTHIE